MPSCCCSHLLRARRHRQAHLAHHDLKIYRSWRTFKSLQVYRHLFALSRLQFRPTIQGSSTVLLSTLSRHTSPESPLLFTLFSPTVHVVNSRGSQGTARAPLVFSSQQDRGTSPLVYYCYGRGSEHPNTSGLHSKHTTG